MQYQLDTEIMADLSRTALRSQQLQVIKIPASLARYNIACGDIMLLHPGRKRERERERESSFSLSLSLSLSE
jgi:hypothetical protein